MKLAYGISAYKDPVHLKRLVSALGADGVEFYVHIDKKVDIGTFRQSLHEYKNCHILEDRYNILWGGWSQVKYQLLFLKEMLMSRNCPDRIFIITGQDYPLWSNKRIRQCAIDFPEKVWMRGINLTQLPSSSHMKRFLSIPHYFRDVDFHNEKLRHYITGGQRELFLKIFPSIRKNYIIVDGQKWDIWQSSGYFSCNREVAQYIIDTMEKNPQIESYFRKTFVPEEITIPTIIFNSKYRDDAEIFQGKQYEGLSTLASLHKFYYSKAIKIYEEKDCDNLIASGKMFCRKVVTGFSDTLMDKIDTYRTEEKEMGVCPTICE